MNDSLEAQAKRQIFVGLSAALSVISDRMRSQQANATKITLLAARAERMAETAWNLNNLTGQRGQQAVAAFIAEIKAFSEEAAAAAARARHEALLGKEVAEAIAGHSADIARLARDIDRLPDASAVRAMLRPLSVTLDTLPERLKANSAAIHDVNGIAALATGLAAHGEKLTARGMVANQSAVELSRELRHFAGDAATFSLKMATEAGLAVAAIDDLAKRSLDLAQGKPVSDVPLTATERMMNLARGGSQAPRTRRAPAAVDTWVSATARPENRTLPRGSTIWGGPPAGKK